MSGSGQKDAILDFLNTEREKLVAFVQRLIDDTAARDGEDIVQDVALNLLNRSDVLMPIEIISAYVYRSLRNKVTDYLRRRRSFLSLDDFGDEDDGLSLIDRLPGIIENMEAEMSRSEKRRRIFEAIDALPDDQKAVVVETELNGKSFSELSDEWEMPIGTLLARKSRGLARIRKAMAEFDSGNAG